MNSLDRSDRRNDGSGTSSSSKEEYDKDNIDGEDKESEEGKEQEGRRRYALRNCTEVWRFSYEKKRNNCCVLPLVEFYIKAWEQKWA